MANKKEKILTIKDVAKLLHIGERSVYRYIKAKKLKAVKIGFWRIEKKSVERFVKQSSNQK